MEKDVLEILSNSHIKLIKDKVKESRPSLYHIKIGKGPWTSIAQQIKDEMTNTEKMKEDNEKLL